MNFYTTGLLFSLSITKLESQAFDNHISIRSMVSSGENSSGHCFSFSLFVFTSSYFPFVLTLSLLLLMSLSKAWGVFWYKMGTL